MSDLKVGDDVIVTARGRIMKIESIGINYVEYRVYDAKTNINCYVCEKNLIKEEDSELTYRSIAKG